MKKRIAFFGPLNPISSGISDYDEELLPLLRQHYDIDVFHSVELDLENVYPHGDFLIRNRRNPYDLNLYQLGNALLHETMYGYLFQFPGVTIFHDLCLHHSRAKMMLQRGMFDEYSEEAKHAHPEEPIVSKLVTLGMGGDLLLYSFPFLRLVAESSLAVGAHTDWGVASLRQFGSPAVKIPMSVNVARSDDVKTSKADPEEIIIASFGFVTPEKRISSVLKVLVDLLQFYPKLRYVIVGEVAKHYDLRREIEERKLQESVVIKGRTSTEEFHLLITRADIIVNLRYPTAREMSATLLRAMALGKPVLMSRLKHLMEIPDDTAIKIRPEKEQTELFHHLWQLIDDPKLRQRIGRKARDYIQMHHRPEQMLEKYRELIEIALERKNTFRSPQLPVHLSSGREMIRDYIRKTAFAGKNSTLLDWIPDKP